MPGTNCDLWVAHVANADCITCQVPTQFPHKEVIRKHTKEEISIIPKHQLLIMKINRKRKKDLEDI